MQALQTSETSHTQVSSTPEFDVKNIIAPQPLNSSQFDNYIVQITDEWETEDGCGFTGDVLLHGQPIFSFENDGEHEGNKYLAHGEKNRENFGTFKEIAIANFPDKLEPIDYALIYLEVRDQQIK